MTNLYIFGFRLLKILFFTLPFSLGTVTNLQAQPVCRTPEISVNSNWEHGFNQYVTKYVAEGRQLNRSLKILPVVIHVIYRNTEDSAEISRQRIESQLTASNLELRRLNADTANTREQFKASAADCDINLQLARKKPDGKSFNGVIYYHLPHYSDAHILDVVAKSILNPRRYLNVWVLPDAYGARAVYPWERSSGLDGFWIGAKYFGTTGNNLSPHMNGGTTFTHELAHYLGVYHTFHRSESYLERCDLAADGTIGDLCADTPLDWTMPLSPEQCETGRRFCGTTPATMLIAQTENFMYYNQDSCTNMFSFDQRSRMRACLDSTRWELSSPSNMASTGISGSVSHCQPFSAPIFCYPNPTGGLVFFNCPEKPVTTVLIRLYNWQGQLLWQIQTSGRTQQLDLSRLPVQVYLLNVDYNGKRSMERIVKKPG